ncbi:hypothetical protein N7489_001288 [Penicillium chrysogenum]|uniref:Uncharacterized protein n=1 Tax=Penicillium chrysogenum TaxID=5076 RepID=A0ABQ8WJ11_PENCH|nr:uncharacterized protein N7489_001288 [Penicillium chrysogenum]KAJ5250878.1 hypothetical protein N7489_001288 [Penicillium chrysogenum]KAJ5262312.1 hypothetical protein N7524_007617 [Penicillium chrysogenum]KAJ5269776.1 hypothetical protein N7505_005534 [Penicillium chrysogenum]
MSSPMPSPIRLSPQISNLQQNSPYLDIYTNVPISPLRIRENTQHLRQTLPHSHPEPKRWESPGAWGARHINDSAPFTLWDEVNRKFHHPTREQSAWIRRKFGDGTLSHNGWLMRKRYQDYSRVVDARISEQVETNEPITYHKYYPSSSAKVVIN